MAQKFANNATSKLASPIDSSSTQLALTPGDGTKFPTLAAGDFFMATLVSAAGQIEIVKVTARNVDSCTIARAQENTAAIAFAAGDRIELRATAGTLQTINDIANQGVSDAAAASASASAANSAATTANTAAGEANTNANGRVSKAGDTMTGPLTTVGRNTAKNNGALPGEWNFQSANGASNSYIRARAGGGFEILDSSYSNINFFIDENGNGWFSNTINTINFISVGNAKLQSDGNIVGGSVWDGALSTYLSNSFAPKSSRVQWDSSTVEFGAVDDGNAYGPVLVTNPYVMNGLRTSSSNDLIYIQGVLLRNA